MELKQKFEVLKKECSESQKDSLFLDKKLDAAARAAEEINQSMRLKVNHL